MIKALLLVLEPIAAWDRIVRAQRSLGFIFSAQLMPLLVLTSVAEAYGLINWGKWRSDVTHLKKFSIPEATVFELSQLVLTLAVVFFGAKLVKSLGETFHGRHTYCEAFTIVAYGLSPLFLLRAFDALRSVSPWVTWAIGIILSVVVLYHGLPRVMLPDPSHAFGLFLSSVLLLVIATGLARFVTAWYLLGKFETLEQELNDLIARLPF